MKLKKPALMKRTGKKSALKVPAIFSDLYNDLRDRRLLLPIALVVVAIAAVPFLLGDAETVAPPPVVGASTPNAESASASLAVVEAEPGLRDYRRRLGNRTAANPFKQQHTSLPESAQIESTAAASSDNSGSEAVVEVEAGESDGGESAPAPGSSGDGEEGTPPDSDGQRFYAYRPNVRFGVAGSDELIVHEHLPLGRLLPQKNPILVFIGSSENGNQVAFNLTREVTRVRGPGRCVGGKEDCSLLILRAGQAVDLMTDVGQTFRLHVIQIEFVEVERPLPAGSSAAAGKRNGLDHFQSFSK